MVSAMEPCAGLAHPGGSSNIPSRFMLRKLEISAGPMGHFARMQTLPLLFKYSIDYSQFR